MTKPAILPAPSPANAVVLVVDDVPENLRIVGELLASQYHIRTANSGPRALELAALSPQPDLILLDVMMPNMNGHQVLESLRTNPATCHIPVIFLTAMHDKESEQLGFQNGAVDYIAKPFTPAIMLARVQTHIALKQTRDQLNRQNAWLEAEVARRTEEVMIIQDVGIEALADLAETRDPETGNHIRRTREYVRLLAQLLQPLPKYRAQISDHYITMVAKSAPLHDIGKVGIPDSILLKPGKLSPDEWKVMQTHAKLGAEAMEKAIRVSGRPVEFLQLACEIAHWHHEKWDGSGYPDGLVGEAIPLSARLMALADVFDALISVRVYKPPMPAERARRIIATGRGKHFDPDAADAFLDNYADFLSIAARYQDSFDDAPNLGEHDIPPELYYANLPRP